MADSKVSELVTATSVGGGDFMYVVQNNTSKKLAVSTLFGNASNVTLKGNVNLSGVQTLGSPGIIDLTKQITHLSSDAIGGQVILPNGTSEQVKIILMTSTAGGTYTVRGNVINNSNIVFSAAGNTATLLYTNSKWFMIGGTAVLN